MSCYIARDRNGVIVGTITPTPQTMRVDVQTMVIWQRRGYTIEFVPDAAKAHETETERPFQGDK